MNIRADIMRILRLALLTMLAAASIAAQDNPFTANDSTLTANANFSPDGKHIVFVSHVTRSGRTTNTPLSSGIRIVNSDGKALRTVTPDKLGVFDTQPSMSYDNSKVVFLRRMGKGATDVFVVNVDGTGLRKITDTKEDEARPAFTADGKEVVYIRVHFSSWDTDSRNDTGELFACDVQGGMEKLLIGKEYRVAQAIPSPKAGAFTILAIALDAAGNPVQPLKESNNGLATAIPAIAAMRKLPPARPIPGFKVPSGADPQIVFISMAKEKNAYLIAAHYGTDYYLLSRSGTESIGNLPEANMNISPDGTKLVSGSRTSQHIKLYDIATKTWSQFSVKP